MTLDITKYINGTAKLKLFLDKWVKILYIYILNYEVLLQKYYKIHIFLINSYLIYVGTVTLQVR